MKSTNLRKHFVTQSNRLITVHLAERHFKCETSTLLTDTFLKSEILSRTRESSRRESSFSKLIRSEVQMAVNIANCQVPIKMFVGSFDLGLIGAGFEDQWRLMTSLPYDSAVCVPYFEFRTGRIGDNNTVWNAPPSRHKTLQRSVTLLIKTDFAMTEQSTLLKPEYFDYL